jgi:hypothetical protein
MQMECNDFIELYSKAIYKSQEERLWQQWLIDYSRMDSEHFINYENYKKKNIKNKTENNSINIENIIKEAEKIKKSDQKGGKLNADI